MCEYSFYQAEDRRANVKNHASFGYAQSVPSGPDPCRTNPTNRRTIFSDANTQGGPLLPAERLTGAPMSIYTWHATC